jgi:hypothetical protein
VKRARALFIHRQVDSTFPTVHIGEITILLIRRALVMPA